LGQPKPEDRDNRALHDGSERRLLVLCIRAFRTPKSIQAKIAPNPRAMDDAIWAKLLWAGLNLTEADLPKIPRPKEQLFDRSRDRSSLFRERRRSRLEWPLPEDLDHHRLEELLFPVAAGGPSKTIGPCRILPWSAGGCRRTSI
jgi:hypothetical protein